MNLIAIDPGSHRVGIAAFQIIEAHGKPGHQPVKFMRAQAVNVEGMSLASLSMAIVSTIDELLGRESPDLIAIETPGSWLGGRALNGKQFNVSMAAISTLFTAIGVIRLTAENMMRAADKVRVVTDGDVKYAVAGRKNAKKHEVHRVLPVFGYDLPQLGKATCADCRNSGYDDKHSPDAADAIAIGHAVASTVVDVPVARPMKWGASG